MTRDQLIAQIMRNFTYHAPNDQAEISRYADLRRRAKDFALTIADYCPVSREQALAITKLEECVMWANAAIARNHGDGEE